LYKAGITSPPYMGNIRVNLVLHQLIIPDW